MKIPALKSLKFQMPFLVLLGIIPIISLAIYGASNRASSEISQESEENLILKTELLSQSIESWDDSNDLALVNLTKQPDIINTDSEKAKAILYQLVNTYDHLYLAMTIGVDGKNLARNDDKPLKDYSDRQYFQSALEGNKISYQTLISRTTREPALCLSSPIERANEIKAVAAICTDLKILTQQVGQLNFGTSGYAFVVDRNGDILVHPNLEYLSGAELTNFSNYPPVKQLLENNSGLLSFRDSQSKNWISYSKRLSNGLGVVVLQEKSEFFKNQQEFQHLAFGIGLVAIVSVSGLTFIVANRMVGPLSKLTNAASNIAAGKLDRRVAIKGDNELGLLGAAFNQMSAQLQSSFTNLKVAKEEAVAANKAKDRFIANISHELRTPLNGILGYTKLLRRELNLKPQQVEEFNIIEKSGYHLLTLINDLLDFSKNQAKPIELHPVDVNLPEFLKEVVAIVESEAKEKNLPIVTKFQNLPNRIKADDKRLQQILINLLNNAIKFTDRGRVVLKVSAINDSNRTSNRQTIRFEVIDTGIGIAPEDINKIFKPFEQTRDASLRNVGTGLGLSIGQQLVNLMGGKLLVKSNLGQGSNFWFQVVFDLASLQPENPPETRKYHSSRRRVKIENISGYKGSQRTILVVDDKQANRWLLVNILEPLGFRVLTASDGEAMFDVINQERPDLICLDLFMPKKTGFSSAKQLRERSQLNSIPIVVISATSITEEMRQYLQCDAFLSKPVDENELLLVLQEYLNLEWIYHDESLVTTTTRPPLS